MDTSIFPFLISRVGNIVLSRQQRVLLVLMLPRLLWPLPLPLLLRIG